MARPAKYPREMMLERAMDLFWTKGYEATSVQNLLDSLDIHRGTLYDSFGDKHGLYMEVLAHYRHTVGGQLLKILAQPGPKKAIIHQLFDLLTGGLATAEGQRGCLFTNATMELSLADAAVATAVGTSQIDLTAAFERTLTEAQQAGEIPQRTPEDVHTLAQFLVTSIQGLRVLARTNSNLTELRQITKIALSVLD
jgi:TetR/AcrR family transcriptional repressor of nem operon